MQKQNAIKGQQSQDKSGADAKATGAHPAVSKQKSDSSDTEKKSVQFAEDEKEEKKISKIRKELIESKNAKTNQYSKRGRGGREYRGEERRGERYKK